MTCRAVVQSQAGLERLVMAGNTSRRMGLFEMEVWSDRDHADGSNADREQSQGTADGSSARFRKSTSTTKVSRLHRCDENKENLDPAWKSDRPFSAVNPPCLRQRYPLQDITALIQSLQGLEMQTNAGISHRLAADNNEGVWRNETSFTTIQSTNMKRSGLLQMR